MICLGPEPFGQLSISTTAAIESPEFLNSEYRNIPLTAEMCGGVAGSVDRSIAQGWLGAAAGPWIAAAAIEGDDTLRRCAASPPSGDAARLNDIRCWF
ncbi:hypothetical protein A5647_14310 [Mycobacterium sp. 1100029.7]|nr:hypothetical protein A5647_14310 [Mycobacterium sp. 1100029.7]